MTIDITSKYAEDHKELSLVNIIVPVHKDTGLIDFAKLLHDISHSLLNNPQALLTTCDESLAVESAVHVKTTADTCGYIPFLLFSADANDDEAAFLLTQLDDTLVRVAEELDSL